MPPDSRALIHHLTPVRERVTWTRWDAKTLRMRTTRPYLWMVTDLDGEERSFATRAEADSWIASYKQELADAA